VLIAVCFLDTIMSLGHPAVLASASMATALIFLAMLYQENNDAKTGLWLQLVTL
jgi:hypothetical protein